MITSTVRIGGCRDLTTSTGFYFLALLVCISPQVTALSVINRDSNRLMQPDGSQKNHHIVARDTSPTSSIFDAIAPSERHSSHASHFISYACERDILTLRCHHNTRMQVMRATYGRPNWDVCLLPGSRSRGVRRHCTSTTRSSRVMQGICDGERICNVPVINYLLGDPCPRTYKFLEVYYRCVPSVA